MTGGGLQARWRHGAGWGGALLQAGSLAEQPIDVAVADGHGVGGRRVADIAGAQRLRNVGVQAVDGDAPAGGVGQGRLDPVAAILFSFAVRHTGSTLPQGAALRGPHRFLAPGEAPFDGSVTGWTAFRCRLAEKFAVAVWRIQYIGMLVWGGWRLAVGDELLLVPLAGCRHGTIWPKAPLPLLPLPDWVTHNLPKAAAAG